jgi:threonyl-tRNA synthetase
MASPGCFPGNAGLDDVRLELSTRPEKSIGSDEMWQRAEGAAS